MLKSLRAFSLRFRCLRFIYIYIYFLVLIKPRAAYAEVAHRLAQSELRRIETATLERQASTPSTSNQESSDGAPAPAPGGDPDEQERADIQKRLKVAVKHWEAEIAKSGG